MNKFKKIILNQLPLFVHKNARAQSISIINRLSNIVFGAPNWRRANGIISTKFEAYVLFDAIRKFVFKNSNCAKHSKQIFNDPVYELDRIGTRYNEQLPRIWLSERVYNTCIDGSRRVFVECYPVGHDPFGRKALELADRYIGEGIDRREILNKYEKKQCFQAAEILLAHAVVRGNKDALYKLKVLYEDDVCNGHYWKSYLEINAKHAKSA